MSDPFMQAAIAEVELGLCEGSIPKVVIEKNKTFQGPEAYLQSRGVELVHLQDERCKTLMTDFIARQPTLCFEDIGE